MKNRKIFNLAISLFLAFLLWNNVSSDEKYDWKIENVPVVCSNEQELQTKYGLMISEKSATTVSVTFKGTRDEIRLLKKHQKDIKAVVDTKAFTSEREYSSGYTILPPPALQDNLPNINRREPTTIRFTVEKFATKSVPVKGVFEGKYASGFNADIPTVSQDFVTVSGPAADVERVQYALAILYGDNVSENISESVALTPVDANNEPVKSQSLTLSENEVTATLTVLTEKEVPLTVEIIPGGGATEENSIVTLSEQTVVLRGEKSTLDAISELSIGGLLLGNVETDDAITYEVIAPENTELVTRIDKVTVSVTFKDLKTRSATLSEFMTTDVEKNSDDRLKARVVTQSLELLLRGPAEALGKLKDEELVAVADLSNYTAAGEYTVPVTIRTPDESVGAVGEYTVEIVLYMER